MRQPKFVLISSGPSPAIAGGYGAFGWYSDHPNHEGIGHRRRRRSPKKKKAPTPLAASSDQASAGSTASAIQYQGTKGRVGPVYTFVNVRQPKANFKWGVRHVAGVQYGK